MHQSGPNLSRYNSPSSSENFVIRLEKVIAPHGWGSAIISIPMSWNGCMTSNEILWRQHWQRYAQKVNSHVRISLNFLMHCMNAEVCQWCHQLRIQQVPFGAMIATVLVWLTLQLLWYDKWKHDRIKPAGSNYYSHYAILTISIFDLQHSSLSMRQYIIWSSPL